MCFSASASFGAGALLSVIGVASIKKAQSPSHVPFASIPLIFAVQQISEGVLWMALSNPAYASLQQISTYFFLFFAEVLWPIWVPYAVLRLESIERRRKILKGFVGLGALVSLYLAFCLWNYPVVAKAMEHHIFYKQSFPLSFSHFASLIYVVATVGPHFISSIKRMRIFGTTVLISYIVTAIFYTQYLVSVWCFFSSLISIIILAIMFKVRDTEAEISDSTVAEVPVRTILP